MPTQGVFILKDADLVPGTHDVLSNSRLAVSKKTGVSPGPPVISGWIRPLPLFSKRLNGPKNRKANTSAKAQAQARSRYVPSEVLIRIRSPWLMNGGTW